MALVNLSGTRSSSPSIKMVDRIHHTLCIYFSKTSLVEDLLCYCKVLNNPRAGLEYFAVSNAILDIDNNPM